MKLSKAQKHVLRTMWQHKLLISLSVQLGEYWEARWVGPKPRQPRITPDPNVKILRALERKGLLKCERYHSHSYCLDFNHKGREIAREL